MASNKALSQALQNELINARLTAIEQVLSEVMPSFKLDFGNITLNELDTLLSAADRKLITDELTAIKSKYKVK